LGREVLDKATRDAERILLEIRISDGLELDLVKQINPNTPKLVSQFIADGFIDGLLALRGRLVLTLKGRLLADSLVRQILE
jgi:oxygen-independent coproporphyrinogen-3 oxidase